MLASTTAAPPTTSPTPTAVTPPTTLSALCRSVRLSSCKLATACGLDGSTIRRARYFRGGLSHDTALKIFSVLMRKGVAYIDALDWLRQEGYVLPQVGLTHEDEGLRAAIREIQASRASHATQRVIARMIRAYLKKRDREGATR